MVGIVGDAEKAPPSILYCVVKLDTAATVGNVNAALHVFAGAVIFGAVGNIVTLTILLAEHPTGPEVVVVVLPQSAVRKYCATTV